MGSSYAGGEMCMESGSGRASAAGRRGGKKAAAEQEANKQPQRGLGVAQLEKIRLHNQMMAAYRSGQLTTTSPHHQDVVGMQVSLAAPGVAPVAGVPSSFQPYHLTDRGFEAAERGIIGLQVQYYDNLLPYGSSPPAATLLAHDVRDSSGQKLGQGRQQHYWLSTSDGSSTEELDLELRL